jgi:hypothetical protein
MRVKAYIPEYDLQGTDVEIADVMKKEDWERTKQTLITDFIRNFSDIFRKKYKTDFDDFGKGFYKDNAVNRRLGRVGKPYDKGVGLRNRLTEMLRNRQIKVTGFPKFFISGKRWTEKERKYVFDMASKGLKAKQISMRLLRTIYAIYKRREWKEGRALHLKLKEIDKNIKRIQKEKKSKKNKSKR